MINDVSNTLTEKEIPVTIDINPSGWRDRVLQKVKLQPKKRTFNIGHITLGNVIRISKIVNEFDITIEEDKALEQMHGFMSSKGDALAEIVAIGLLNKKSDPTEKEVQFVKDNFTSAEVLGVVAIILKQTNVGNFIYSIASIKGVNILKASPVDQGS